MASSTILLALLAMLLTINSLLHLSAGARQLTALVEPQPLVISYHKGQLLSGPLTVNLIWYGKFSPNQRAIVADFISSLSSNSKAAQPLPSVSTWWGAVEKYHLKAKVPLPSLTLGSQILDEAYSLGKRLTSSHLIQLAAKGGKQGTINVVLTGQDVVVDGFCSSRCGTHGASPRSKDGRYTFIWVGNSAEQCPGQCAWPFHQAMYGPQTPALVAPNGDVGVDGMIIHLASLLAGTVTNPFGDGYYHGTQKALLEAASACTGVYAKGAYPGYAGELLIDSTTSASYNAIGANGRKYLLPAMVDPSTSTCSTLV